MAIAGMLLGAVITFLTYWLVYALVWFVANGVTAVSQGFFGTRVRVTTVWRHGATGLFMLLVVIDSVRRSALDANERPKSRYLPSFAAAGGLLFAFGQILAHPQASSTMIVSLLEAGPRLFLGSCSMWLEVLRMKFDPAACLPVIDLLAAHPRAVTWEELHAAFPEADWESLTRQLRAVACVVFLVKGLSLSEDFRSELWMLQQSGEGS